jgi:site-specific recombinase XerD
MDIEELKVLMGHNSVKTTEIYGEMQLSPELREKYEKTV